MKIPYALDGGEPFAVLQPILGGGRQGVPKPATTVPRLTERLKLYSRIGIHQKQLGPQWVLLLELWEFHWFYYLVLSVS